MALLFPVLFLLWCLILWTLFKLYAGVLSEVAMDRVILAWEADPEVSPSRMRSEIELLVRNSGIGAQIENFSFEIQENLFFEQIRSSLTLSHTLFGKTTVGSRRSCCLVQGTTVRNILDLIWDIGEELPGTGEILRNYQAQIERIKNIVGS